jgi:hypothetical protein
VLVATLTPMGGRKPHISLCLVCGQRGAADVLLNVILYAPLGVAIALCGWRPPKALLAPALLSAAIECAQIWIPGRDPSLGDVTFNTLGAALGVLAVGSSSLWLQPRPRLRRVLEVCAALGLLSVLGATGVLLRPDFPRSTYYGQWTPHLSHLAWYRGRVLSVSLGSRSLVDGPLAGSDQVRSLLMARAPLDVRSVAGPRVPALGSLFSIADDWPREIVLLGPDRGDLVVRYRTRAAAVGLDEPDLRVSGAMRRVSPGDSLNVVVRADGRGYCLAINGQATCGLGFTVGRGWALLYYPESFPRWLRKLLDDGWMAGLLIPLGFWSRGRRSATLFAAAVLVTIWAVPRATGLLSAPPGEVAGAVVGFALGRLLQRLVAARRRETPASAL